MSKLDKRKKEDNIRRFGHVVLWPSGQNGNASREPGSVNDA